MTAPGCHASHPGRDCQRAAPGGYCVPPRCYCGSCPWFVPLDVRATNTPDSYTAFDRQAIARGQRATGAQRRRQR